MIIMKNWKIFKERRWFIPVVLIGILVAGLIGIISRHYRMQKTNYGTEADKVKEV